MFVSVHLSTFTVPFRRQHAAVKRPPHTKYGTVLPRSVHGAFTYTFAEGYGKPCALDPLTSNIRVDSFHLRSHTKRKTEIGDYSAGAASDCCAVFPSRTGLPATTRITAKSIQH